MTSSSQIEINADVCNGKTVIQGIRITVQTVLEFLTAGDNIADVLEEYPELKQKNVYTCIDYASIFQQSSHD